MLLIIVAYVTVSIKAVNSGGGFYVTMSMKEMFQGIILMLLCITDIFSIPVRVTISMTKMFQQCMFVYVTMSMTKNVSRIYIYVTVTTT